MSGQVVVGVDGTDGGRRALAWALRYAADTGARLLVASVYYDPAARPDRTPSPRAAWARREAERDLATDLEETLATAERAPEVDTIVIPGDVIAHALADLAENADLLVVGSHGHGALAGRLLGTVSMGCVTSAVCPVLVVPARDRQAPDRSQSDAVASSSASGPSGQ